MQTLDETRLHLKISIPAIATVALFLCATTATVRTAPGPAVETVPFPFPTYPPGICQGAVLDANGATVTNAKLVPVKHGDYIVGCKLTFLTAKPGDLKPPFKATFTDGSGKKFVVSADQIGSSDPTAVIPGGWNRVQNVKDYDPQNP